MELKDQVCSLELAKRLKELGVKKNSLFYWDSHCIEELKTQGNYGITSDGEYSAFTVAELGEMLPDEYLTIRFSDKKYTATTATMIANYTVMEFYEEDNTEADARAKMLIFLLENNYVKLEDINE